FKTGDKLISTQDLFFTLQGTTKKITGNDSASFTFRMDLGEGKYIDYIYGIKGNSYLVDFDVVLNGINDVISPGTNNINLSWDILTPNQEKSIENQEMNTTVYFKNDDGVDYISE